MKKEIIAYWIETILLEGKGLTKWETEFIEDMEETLLRHGTFTDTQQAKIEEIYTEKTA